MPTSGVACLAVPLPRPAWKNEGVCEDALSGAVALCRRRFWAAATRKLRNSAGCAEGAAGAERSAPARLSEEFIEGTAPPAAEGEEGATADDVESAEKVDRGEAEEEAAAAAAAAAAPGAAPFARVSDKG